MSCELDVLVLGAATAPYQHGETTWWPPGGLWWSRPVHAAWSRYLAASGASSRYFVIPEDVERKLSMADGCARWCDRCGPRGGERVAPAVSAPAGAAWRNEWVWCGAPLSYFQAEFFEAAELFPARRLRVYDLALPVPLMPWALLNRTYGPACGHVAFLNEHGGHEFVLSRYAHFRLPARVRWHSGHGYLGPPTQRGTTMNVAPAARRALGQS